jgi:hypothetical protein
MRIARLPPVLPIVLYNGDQPLSSIHDQPTAK